jgi:hypothetical protein
MFWVVVVGVVWLGWAANMEERLQNLEQRMEERNAAYWPEDEDD